MHRIERFFVTRMHGPIAGSATALTPHHDARRSSDLDRVSRPRESGKTARLSRSEGLRPQAAPRGI